MWTKILLVFLGIVLLKAASNFVKMQRCKILMKRYNLWCANKYDKLAQYRREILMLFKTAGVEDVSTPISESIGHGRAAAFDASVLTNFPSKRVIMIAPMFDMFDEAIGEYRRRCAEAFNPLYWIETVIFFPRHLLEYVGLDSEKAAFRLVNILMTFTWWIIGACLVFFKSQLHEFIASLL